MARMQQTIRGFPPMVWMAILLIVASTLTVVGILLATDVFSRSISPPGSGTGQGQAPADIGTTRIDLPPRVTETPKQPTIVFRGRETPSAIFPFSDKEYIAAGKAAITDSSIRGQESVMQNIRGSYLESISYLEVTPLRVDEYVNGTLYVTFQVAADGGRIFGRFVVVQFLEGENLVADRVDVSLTNRLTD